MRYKYFFTDNYMTGWHGWNEANRETPDTTYIDQLPPDSYDIFDSSNNYRFLKNGDGYILDPLAETTKDKKIKEDKIKDMEKSIAELMVQNDLTVQDLIDVILKDKVK